MNRVRIGVRGVGRWAVRKLGLSSRPGRFLADGLRSGRDALRPDGLDLSGLYEAGADGGKEAFSRAFGNRSAAWLDRRQRHLALQGLLVLAAAIAVPLLERGGWSDLGFALPPAVLLMLILSLHCFFRAWQLRRRRLAPFDEFLAGLPRALFE